MREVPQTGHDSIFADGDMEGTDDNNIEAITASRCYSYNSWL